MQYEEARSYIEDGDAIIIHGKGGLLTPFTKFFTRSSYTHAGLAFWMDGVLWLAEINSGNDHAIPLSQLSNAEFDVFARPAGITAAQAKAAILEELRDKTAYGFLGIPVIGLLNFLKLSFQLPWRRIIVCSGLCLRVYMRAGFPPVSLMQSPADLARLLTLKFRVRPQDAPLKLAA